MKLLNNISIYCLLDKTLSRSSDKNHAIVVYFHKSMLLWSHQNESSNICFIVKLYTIDHNVFELPKHKKFDKHFHTFFKQFFTLKKKMIWNLFSCFIWEKIDFDKWFSRNWNSLWLWSFIDEFCSLVINYQDLYFRTWPEKQRTWFSCWDFPEKLTPQAGAQFVIRSAKTTNAKDRSL